jgi:hypothetical protein
MRSEHCASFSTNEHLYNISIDPWSYPCLTENGLRRDWAESKDFHSVATRSSMDIGVVFPAIGHQPQI